MCDSFLIWLIRKVPSSYTYTLTLIYSDLLVHKAAMGEPIGESPGRQAVLCSPVFSWLCCIMSLTHSNQHPASSSSAVLTLGMLLASFLPNLQMWQKILIHTNVGFSLLAWTTMQPNLKVRFNVGTHGDNMGICILLGGYSAKNKKKVCAEISQVKKYNLIQVLWVSRRILHSCCMICMDK